MPSRTTPFRLVTGSVLSGSQQNENWKDNEAAGEAFHGNRIISGFAATATTGTALSVDIAAGVAYIGGRHIAPAAGYAPLAIPPSVTRWVWLKGTNDYTDTAGVIADVLSSSSFELTAASGSPTGDGALICSVTTDGSDVTSVTDMRDFANVWVDRDTYTFASDIASFDTTTRIFKARMEEVINVGFGGAGTEIADNTYQTIYCPYAFTITGVTLLADVSGSIVIDIWKDTYANHPPTNADTICASAPPTITTATKSQDTTLTGWTLTVAAGSELKFLVESCTTITQCTLALHITRAGA
jgi:hypothetical protein